MPVLIHSCTLGRGPPKIAGTISHTAALPFQGPPNISARAVVDEKLIESKHAWLVTRPLLYCLASNLATHVLPGWLPGHSCVTWVVNWPGLRLPIPSSVRSPMDHSIRVFVSCTGVSYRCRVHRCLLHKYLKTRCIVQWSFTQVSRTVVIYTGVRRAHVSADHQVLHLLPLLRLRRQISSVCDSQLEPESCYKTTFNVQFIAVILP